MQMPLWLEDGACEKAPSGLRTWVRVAEQGVGACLMIAWPESGPERPSLPGKASLTVAGKPSPAGSRTCQAAVAGGARVSSNAWI